MVKRGPLSQFFQRPGMKIQTFLSLSSLLLLSLLLVAATTSVTAASEEPGSLDVGNLAESEVAETGETQLSRKKRFAPLLSFAFSIGSKIFSMFATAKKNRSLKEIKAALVNIDAKLDSMNNLLVSLLSGVEWLEDVMMFQDDVMRIHYLLDELKRVDLNNTEEYQWFGNQVTNQYGGNSNIQQVLFELHSMVTGDGFLFGKNSVLSLYLNRMTPAGQSRQWFMEAMCDYTSGLQISGYSLWLLSLDSQGRLDDAARSKVNDLMQSRFNEQTPIIQKVIGASTPLFEETEPSVGYMSIIFGSWSSVNTSTVEAMRMNTSRPLAGCRLYYISKISIECEAYELTNFVNGSAPISENGRFLVNTGTPSASLDIDCGQLSKIKKGYHSACFVVSCLMNRVPDPQNQTICGAKLVYQNRELTIAIKVCSRDMSSSFWQLQSRPGTNDPADLCYSGTDRGTTIPSSGAVNANWQRPSRPGWITGLGLASNPNGWFQLRSEFRYF